MFNLLMNRIKGKASQPFFAALVAVLFLSSVGYSAPWMSAPSGMRVNDEVVIQGGGFEGPGAIEVRITSADGSVVEEQADVDVSGKFQLSFTFDTAGEYTAEAFSEGNTNQPAAGAIIVIFPAD